MTTRRHALARADLGAAGRVTRRRRAGRAVERERERERKREREREMEREREKEREGKRERRKRRKQRFFETKTVKEAKETEAEMKKIARFQAGFRGEVYTILP